MGTNIKINIFETLPVTSLTNANVKKNIAPIFLNMARSTNINTYLFSELITVRGYAFLIQNRAYFLTIHGFAFFPRVLKPSWRKDTPRAVGTAVCILLKETQPQSSTIVKTVWTGQPSNRLQRLGTTACQDDGATHQKGWKGLRSCPRILGKRTEKSGATGTTAPGPSTSDVSNKFDE